MITAADLQALWQSVQAGADPDTVDCEYNPLGILMVWTGHADLDTDAPLPEPVAASWAAVINTLLEDDHG